MFDSLPKYLLIIVAFIAIIEYFIIDAYDAENTSLHDQINNLEVQSTEYLRRLGIAEELAKSQNARNNSDVLKIENEEISKTCAGAIEWAIRQAGKV